MSRTALSAMLTVAVALGSTFAAGCGGKTASSSTATKTTGSTPPSTTTSHKHKSKPAY